MSMPLTGPLRLCGLSLLLFADVLTGGREISGVLRLSPVCLAALRQGRLRLELGFSDTALATASSEIADDRINLRVSTNPVQSRTNVTLTARLIANTLLGELAIDSADFTMALLPAEPPLFIQSVTLLPEQVGNLREVNVTLTLNRAAPLAGVPVSVQAAGVPNITLRVPGGQSVISFQVPLPPRSLLVNVPIMTTITGSSMTVVVRR